MIHLRSLLALVLLGAACQPASPPLELPSALRGQTGYTASCPVAPSDEEAEHVTYADDASLDAFECGGSPSVSWSSLTVGFYTSDGSWSVHPLHAEYEVTTRREGERCVVEITALPYVWKDGEWYPSDGHDARVAACAALRAAFPALLGDVDGRLHRLALHSTDGFALFVEDAPLPLTTADSCEPDAGGARDLSGFTGGYQLELSVSLESWPRLHARSEPVTPLVGFAVVERP